MQPSTLVLSALIILLAVIVALWYWRRSRVRREIEARDSATAVEPKSVLLPEEMDDSEERRRRRRRTGEAQKLERTIIHGDYRPVDDRGAQSAVRSEPPAKKE